MSAYYNQGIKTPVWIVTDLPADVAAELETALSADGAKVFEWPAQSFMTTVHEMAKQGWKHVVNREKPFAVDVNFVSVAAARHIKNTFGPSAMLTGSHARPYQQSLNRQIETEDDYRRLFDEVLSLEGETELSNIFQMAARRAMVYVSRSPVPAAVVNKLARNVLTVGDQNCTVSTKGLTTEELIEAVKNEVDQLLTLR